MIAQIEKPIRLAFESKLAEFEILINTITTNDSLETIMSVLNSRDWTWFKCGRGGSHIWIHDKISNERCILVTE